MDKKLQVDRDVMFFAFRYSLGRSSYAPVSITENIKHNIDNLSDGDLKAYIREIEECDRLGHDMDVRHWNEFKVYLEGELKKRKGDSEDEHKAFHKISEVTGWQLKDAEGNVISEMNLDSK